MKTAILDIRPANAPGRDLRQGDTAELVRLFALDRLPARRPLHCRWRVGADGRLAAIWDPDIGPALQR